MQGHVHEHIDSLAALAERFALAGRVARVVPHGSGWIHASYAVSCEGGAGDAAPHAHARAGPRYLLQRVNRAVFPAPEQVMENVARVTAHQRAALARAGAPDPGRRALALVPTRDGADFALDDDGELWRVYRFIEGARSHDAPRGAADAHAVALAFGHFVAQLADLPGPPLHQTIPRFHDARARFEALLAAVRKDELGRLRDARPEVDALLAREAVADRLRGMQARGALPERITHNDTKINNVLLDERSGEGLCVIDLDTVMPGLLAYDFGDLVRTAACAAAEDERDLARVRVDPALFRALSEGYLRGTNALICDAERAELAFAGRLMTLVVAMRFLTDHLTGDRYFKTQRPGHNLDRARAQLALVRSLESEHGRLEQIVEEAAGAE